jgi:predicted acyltransferase
MAHWNKNSNLAWAFDTWFLNLFPRAKHFICNAGGYATLSFIPTLGTMILGLIAGGWLRVGHASSLPYQPDAQATDEWPPTRTIKLFIATGLALLALGLASHYSGLCPSVKRIWTPAWTLFSGGWCFLILAGFYAIIDVAHISAWSFPLRVIGANSIAAYLIAHGPHRFISDSLKIHLGTEWTDAFGPAYAPLVLGAAVLAIEWLILYWLYCQKIHIRI